MLLHLSVIGRVPDFPPRARESMAMVQWVGRAELRQSHEMQFFVPLESDSELNLLRGQDFE